MSKPVKAMIAESLRETYEGIENVCVVDLTGLNVQEQERVREVLREKSARLQVVRNSLARRAFKDSSLEPLGRALEGPCALVTTPASIIDTAKVLAKAADEFEHLTLKQAMLEGDPELLTVEQVSKMKGRVELLGDLAMLLTSPGRALAGCLGSPQSRIAGCLKMIIDRAA